jgi:energy-coupling factor transport system ATP-binding protein
MSQIQYEDVSFTYDTAHDPAIQDLTLSIESAEFVGVSGPEGAGKTTFAQMLPGFIPHFYDGTLRGEIRINEVTSTTADIATLGTEVGYVFEHPTQQLSGAAMTVEGEIAFGLEQRAVTPSDMETAINDALSAVNISHLQKRDPATLSGGQLQRVAIASVLVLEPNIVVFDQPTGQLDPDGSEAVFDIAQRLAAGGLTVIFITQDMHRLAPRASRLVVFDHGHCVMDDTPRRVLASEAVDELVTIPPTAQLARNLQSQESLSGETTLPLTTAEATQFCQEHDVISSSDGGEQSMNQETGTPRVSFDSVSYRYDNDIQALSDVSTRLYDGCVMLIGENGSGKTTFAKLLNGLLTPTEGRIKIGETLTESTSVAELAETVGLVFQDPDEQLFQSSVGQEIRFGPENIGHTAVDAQVDTVINLLDLEEVRDMNSYELGRGTRKRVAMASVIAMDTSILVFDEPTGEQDRRGRDTIGSVIDTLSEDRLVICITHDMEFAQQHGDRIIALADGEIIADGTPTKVFNKPRVMDKAGVQRPVAAQIAEELQIEHVTSVGEIERHLSASPRTD